MLSGLLVEGFGYDMGEVKLNPSVRCKTFVFPSTLIRDHHDDGAHFMHLPIAHMKV